MAGMSVDYVVDRAAVYKNLGWVSELEQKMADVRAVKTKALRILKEEDLSATRKKFAREKLLDANHAMAKLKKEDENLRANNEIGLGGWPISV
jgi:phosphopantothenoylcysteine synthetase/decarboxylase